MAIESVTLGIEEAQQVQNQLIVGLAALAELKRVREHLDLEHHHGLCDQLRKAGAFPLLPVSNDDDIGDFATAIHLMHMASTGEAT